MKYINGTLEFGKKEKSTAFEGKPFQMCCRFVLSHNRCALTVVACVFICLVAVLTQEWTCCLR